MRPTSQESSTGGVSPFDVAAQHEFEHIAQGAQVIPSGRALGGVTVITTVDPGFDPVNQRLTDPGAVLNLAPPPEVVTYNLPPSGWWAEQSSEQVARRLARYPDAVVDAVREDVVAAIADAYKLWRHAVRAHAGDAERAATEGYEHPAHDRATLHAQAVLQVIDSEREARR